MNTALRWIGIVAALASAAGCDSKPGEGGTSGAGTTASATSAIAAATPTSADPAPAAPPDLDVASLQKALVCAANSKSGPCSVLSAFASCKPWSAEAPSGDGRWLGRGFEVEDKKTTEQVTVLRAKRVPSSEVGPGQLSTRVGLGIIEKEDGAPFSEAERAIRAIERGDVPARGSATISHLKGMTKWAEAFATRTTGGQVYGLAHGGLYVCEGSKRELHVVRRASTRTGNGDGLYATLWAATW